MVEFEAGQKVVSCVLLKNCFSIWGYKIIKKYTYINIDGF
jgi:hypothetical protein